MQTERIGIVELFERVEAFKAADPRSASRDPHTTIALYVDVSKIIRGAGWGTFEYEAALGEAVG